MDIGTISLILLVGLMLLLAIGMPLGLASAFMAVVVLVMKFEPTLLLDPTTFGDGLLTRKFGTGPLNILAQKIYGLLTDYVLISIPLFIFMAALFGKIWHCQGHVFVAKYLVVAGSWWDCNRNLCDGGHYGSDVRDHRRRS